MPGKKFLRFRAVELASEPLVAGFLRRRNILTYEPPPGHKGFDLLCTHPESRRGGHRKEVRVQVKSRYASDCDRSVPVKKSTLYDFDFLVVVFLNVGKFERGKSGSTGGREPEFFTLPARLARRLFQDRPKWSKVSLRGLDAKLKRYKGEGGFEQIARALGVPKPRRP